MMPSPTTPVEIMFSHRPSKSVTFCKVAFAKLNWKLRKLQNESMFVLGIYVLEEVECEGQLALPFTSHEEVSNVRQIRDVVEGANCGSEENCRGVEEVESGLTA